MTDRMRLNRLPLSTWRFAMMAFLALFFMANSFAVRADDGFQNWVKAFRGEALQNGISQKTFDLAFKGLTPDPSVLKAANNQAEFTRAIWDYLDRAVSEWRIKEGKAARRPLERDLVQIEKKWGVDRSVLVAIWGLESSYGAILDNGKIVKGVVRSLATLAYGDETRARFGRTQLLAALKILENGDTTAARMTGSWAGAMGHTQFIPTTYLAHAVDYDGDGRRDIWSSPQDALASAANYLAESGWEKGHGWGYEVTLPAKFDYSLADQKTRKRLAAWSDLGIRRVRGNAFPRPDDEAKLFLPAGARGPAFLLLKNFDVIKRYNNANAYALAIGHLSDRLKGFGPFRSDWPRDLKPLSRTQKEDLQTLLTANGFDTGGVDGRIGPKSRTAIRAYQTSRGLVPDGFETESLLNTLRSKTSSE